MNFDQHQPPYPYYPSPPYSPPSAGEPGFRERPYTGTLGTFKTERELQLERQLDQAEGVIKSLEIQNTKLQRALAESQSRIFRWRLNIRNSMIAFLSIFITVWATVSILAQYPVLPWDMPSAVYHLFSR